MLRIAEREHHVVGDVDDVRDRAHPGARQPRLQPCGRLAEPHVAEEPADVPRARVEILDLDCDRVATAQKRLLAGHCAQIGAEQRCDFARNAVDRHQVGPVVQRLDLEDVVADREHVGERRAGHQVVGENHDPAVVLADLELALGEDHPLGDLAAELALLDREVTRHHSAGQHDRDGRARAEVPRAADDRARLAAPDVDLRQLQLVGVRMLVGLEHLADDEVLEVRAARCALAHDPVDLTAREDETARELLDRQVEVDVLAQP